MKHSNPNQDQAKTIQPYNDQGLNVIYNLLFCDNLELYKTDQTSVTKYPWNVLFSPIINSEDIFKVAGDQNIETRQRILAYNILRNHNIKITEKHLLGVIIEINFENGLDTLAVYKDQRARYINQSEKIIIWENKNKEAAKLIDQLFQAGANVVNKIGPWDKSRLIFPNKGHARITFLVADGLYFGEASTETLFQDPLGSMVLKPATTLMRYLINNNSQ